MDLWPTSISWAASDESHVSRDTFFQSYTSTSSSSIFTSRLQTGKWEQRVDPHSPHKTDGETSRNSAFTLHSSHSIHYEGYIYILSFIYMYIYIVIFQLNVIIFMILYYLDTTASGLGWWSGSKDSLTSQLIAHICSWWSLLKLLTFTRKSDSHLLFTVTR